jgi:hypothetical protein
MEPEAATGTAPIEIDVGRLKGACHTFGKTL